VLRRDELVVIVSSASAIAGLTKDQIADIFLGKLRQLPDGTKVVPIDSPKARRHATRSMSSSPASRRRR
jgi:ABC-type phosphate transport system substrate-binding protein